MTTPSRLRVLASSVVLLGGGLLVLGRDWQGHAAAPGLWRDGVPLRSWGLWWALTFVLGSVTGRSLASRGARALALVPIVGWYGWMLRDSALGPVAWAFYSAVTAAAWFAGGELGSVIGVRGAPRDAPPHRPS